MIEPQPTFVPEGLIDQEWQQMAKCNDGTGEMTDLFFSSNPEHIADAKAFCMDCVVREECLTFARAIRAVGAVWGGEYFNNSGKITDGPSKRGRPKLPKLDI